MGVRPVNTRLQDFRQQMLIWGYAVSDLGDIATIASEQRHPTRTHRPATTDALGRAVWDDPARLENVHLIEVGRRQAIPYWWALPGVIDGLLSGIIEERRHYTNSA